VYPMKILFLTFIVSALTFSACKKETAPVPVSTSLLEVWPEGDDVRVKVPAGAIALDPQHSFVLSPEIDGAVWEDWVKTSSATAHEMKRVGEYRGSAVSLKWDFSVGNPQTVFSWSMQSPAAAALGEPVVLTFLLPKGDVRYVNASERLTPFVGRDVVIPPLAPRWLEWRGAQRTLVFSEWKGDSLRLKESGDFIALELVVYDPAFHADPKCSIQPGPDIVGGMSVVFGEELPVFASRLADGRQSALVPIFVDGGTTAVGHDGASLNPEDYARRIRTLAFGHSDPSDPRHGNGGLVGTELGGTFLVSKAQRDSDSFDAMSDSLFGTTVDLAVDGDATTARAACDGKVFPKTQTILEAGEIWSGNYRNEVANIPVPHGGTPIVWKTPVLDGSREALVGQILSKPYLDQALRDRAVLAFQTPLVATRNPLVDAYHNSLLAPERNGMWTIGPEVERVLAGLELEQEIPAHAVLSADSLLNQVTQAWAVRIDRRADGTWATHGKMDGFTLIVEGQREVSVEKIEPMVQKLDVSSQAQTWATFDLDGSAKISISDAPVLKGVRWVFEP
jgi:hypothetical protein